MPMIRVMRVVRVVFVCNLRLNSLIYKYNRKKDSTGFDSAYYIKINSYKIHLH